MTQSTLKEKEDFNSEVLEEIIRDTISGIKDSVHIHDFVRKELSRERNEVLEEVKGIVYEHLPHKVTREYRAEDMIRDRIIHSISALKKE